MRYRFETFGNQIKATKEGLLIAYGLEFEKKVTFINEQNWRITVGVVAPVDSANQDLSLFLEHFGLLEGVFSAEERGSFKIGKLDDSR